MEESNERLERTMLISEFDMLIGDVAVPLRIIGKDGLDTSISLQVTEPATTAKPVWTSQIVIVLGNEGTVGRTTTPEIVFLFVC
jgi:hypothetical protein